MDNFLDYVAICTKFIFAFIWEAIIAVIIGISVVLCGIMYITFGWILDIAEHVKNKNTDAEKAYVC